MKRLIAILFLFSFLSTNSVFGEILKLPVLVQHYFDHSAENKDISVWDFIVQHYGKDIDPNHQKDHHHDKLPFKTTDTHSTQVVSLAETVWEASNPIPHSSKLTPSFYPEQIYANACSDRIWQPPKIS